MQLLQRKSNMFQTVDLTGLGHADFWLVHFIISFSSIGFWELWLFKDI